MKFSISSWLSWFDGTLVVSITQSLRELIKCWICSSRWQMVSLRRRENRAGHFVQSVVAQTTATETWRVESHFILSTSYSTARSLLVKELSTLTSGGRKIWTVADSLPRKRKTGFLPGCARRTISMAILHKIRNSIQKRETYQPYPDIKNC